MFRKIYLEKFRSQTAWQMVLKDAACHKVLIYVYTYGFNWPLLAGGRHRIYILIGPIDRNTMQFSFIRGNEQFLFINKTLIDSLGLEG